MKIDIDLDITAEEFKELAKKDKVAAGRKLRNEVMRFSDYLVSNGVSPLAEWEMVLIIEFLGKKIVEGS